MDGRAQLSRPRHAEAAVEHWQKNTQFQLGVVVATDPCSHGSIRGRRLWGTRSRAVAAVHLQRARPVRVVPRADLRLGRRAVPHPVVVVAVLGGAALGVLLEVGDDLGGEGGDDDMDAAMSPEDEEEVDVGMMEADDEDDEDDSPGMRYMEEASEDEIVAEVAKRVAERLQAEKEHNDIAEQLAERIFNRLSGK